MEPAAELDLDEVLELAKSDQHKCIQLLVKEIKRLKSVIHANEEKFKEQILAKDEQIDHKMEKYHKVFNSFSRVLINNGFGSSHPHFHHSRTSKKFEESKDGTHHHSDSGSDEFLSFAGDGYESDEEIGNVKEYPKDYM